MEKYILPFSVTIDNIVTNEIDLSIPEQVALNNLEAASFEIESLKKLMKKMTIGKKILLERCERYETLKRFGSAADIVLNEQELIEKSIIDFIAAREEFYKELDLAS